MFRALIAAVATAVAANFITCPEAFAQNPPTDPGISAPPITSSPPSVSADTNAPPQYVVYPFKLVNGGGSSINLIRITGVVSHTFATPAGFGTAFAVVSPSTFAPFTCSVTASTASSIEFSCVAAPGYSLPAGQTLTVPIAFSLPGTRTAGEDIDFSATVRFREGNSTSTGGNNDSELTAVSTTAVDTASNDQVAALIPLQTGARFFTGKKGVPQGAGDTVGTQVDAPSDLSGTYAAGNIIETSVATCPVPGVTTCKDTIDISIVNSVTGQRQRFEPTSVTDPLSQYLVIYLRRDASVFKGSINNLVVYYLADGATSYVTVAPCVNGSDPLLGMDHCVYDRRVFKKNDPEVKADPSLLGDGQIRMLGKENGKYAW